MCSTRWPGKHPRKDAFNDSLLRVAFGRQGQGERGHLEGESPEPRNRAGSAQGVSGKSDSSHWGKRK